MFECEEQDFATDKLMRDSSTGEMRFLFLFDDIQFVEFDFVDFFCRFKVVSNKTYPVWKGTPREGCVALLNSLNISASEYQLGQTKIFIKKPQTVRVLLLFSCSIVLLSYSFLFTKTVVCD
jgi:hypothetical protein